MHSQAVFSKIPFPHRTPVVFDNIGNLRKPITTALCKIKKCLSHPEKKLASQPGFSIRTTSPKQTLTKIFSIQSTSPKDHNFQNKQVDQTESEQAQNKKQGKKKIKAERILEKIENNSIKISKIYNRILDKEKMHLQKNINDHNNLVHHEKFVQKLEKLKFKIKKHQLLFKKLINIDPKFLQIPNIRDKIKFATEVEKYPTNKDTDKSETNQVQSKIITEEHSDTEEMTTSSDELSSDSNYNSDDDSTYTNSYGTTEEDSHVAEIIDYPRIINEESLPTIHE